jgi:hypothetical protein
VTTWRGHRLAFSRPGPVASSLRRAAWDIADLIDAGSSLGGARPKAAITNASGRLTIAKFPRGSSDQWDAPAWEEVRLRRTRTIVSEVERATADWQRVAADLGLPKAQANRMAYAYETDQRSVARALSPA